MSSSVKPNTIEAKTEVEGVTISGESRLLFAKQILFCLGIVTVGFFAYYIYDPHNEAVRQIFELVKIGVFPLITLVVSFYFASN